MSQMIIRFLNSGFKTLKYRPDYPARFGCLADARSWAGEFFRWYNYEHHHTGIGLLTPADVHFERTQAMLNQRQQVLQSAYQKNPEVCKRHIHPGPITIGSLDQPAGNCGPGRGL